MIIRKALVTLVAASTILSIAPLPGGHAKAASESAIAKRVISEGKDYLGTPYEFGSNRGSTRTFDCSDFTQQAFWEGAGIKIPSDSRKQAAYVEEIGDTSRSWKNLEPGDLMFFMSYRGLERSNYYGLNKSNQRVTHVAIYMGNGLMLHTYSEDSGVTISRIGDNHWEYRFLFGGSALK